MTVRRRRDLLFHCMCLHRRIDYRASPSRRNLISDLYRRTCHIWTRQEPGSDRHRRCGGGPRMTALDVTQTPLPCTERRRGGHVKPAIGDVD